MSLSLPVHTHQSPRHNSPSLLYVCVLTPVFFHVDLGQTVLSQFEFLHHLFWNRLQQHPFNGSLSAITRVSRYQKGKTNLDLPELETVTSSAGISWAICKTAPCPRHIITPAPHHSVFEGRMLFLLVCYPTNSVKAVHYDTSRNSLGYVPLKAESRHMGRHVGRQCGHRAIEKHQRTIFIY